MYYGINNIPEKYVINFIKGLQNFKKTEMTLKIYYFPLTLRRITLCLFKTTRQILSRYQIKPVIDNYSNYGKFNGSWTKTNCI